MRFVHLDPPGLIRSWKILGFGQRLSSGGFHHGSLDEDACGHIFPERYQQLSRQRHDRLLLKTAAITPDPFFKPQGQRRLRLTWGASGQGGRIRVTSADLQYLFGIRGLSSIA